MNVTSQAAITIDASREVVFDAAVAIENLPKLFRGYGPIASIDKAEIVGDDPELKTGSIRRIHNGDGSVIDERILELERPSRQRYRLFKGFKLPFSLLVSAAEGDWTFRDLGSRTEVTWHFTFELTSPLAYPLTRVISRVFFRRAQELCLATLKQKVDQLPG